MMSTVHAAAEDTGPYSSSWDGKILLQLHIGIAGHSQHHLLRWHAWQFVTNHLFAVSLSTMYFHMACKEWRQTVYVLQCWAGSLALPSSTGVGNLSDNTNGYPNAINDSVLVWKQAVTSEVRKPACFTKSCRQTTMLALKWSHRNLWKIENQI